MEENRCEPPGQTRKLAAILVADVAGYSRLMALDDVGTVNNLNEARIVFRREIGRFRGAVIDMTGDSVLATFPSAFDAVQCALEVQSVLSTVNEARPTERRMLFRIGLNLGDIIEQPDGTVYGDGVNIAARLESIGEPGGICASETVFEQVKTRVAVPFEFLGEQQVKNLAEPIRAFRVMREDSGSVAAGLSGALPLPEKPSIAVLPFNNMSSDPEQEFFADGVVESITASLSRIRSFFVIARNSAFRYKGRPVDVLRVGRELGVQYLLEGSVQKACNRLRLTVQLIDATNGAHVWADRLDGSVEDVFDLQDRITELVAGALQPSIRLAEIERARRKRPQELGAYDYTMRALPHVWSLERDACGKALDLLKEALARDPDYPLALSLAGWCHAQRSVYNWTDDLESAHRSALAHAEKAAEHSSDDPLILAVLGAVHTVLRNYGTARVMLERAVALDPNAAWAWSRLGWLENYSDRPERAKSHFERAIRLSPLDPINFNNYVGLGAANYIDEHYEEAVAFHRRALQERPHAVWILRGLVPALTAAGRMNEAVSEFKALMTAYPNLTVAKFKKAQVFSPATLDRMAAHVKILGLPD
jgi:adenylate cyclase